ncbi:hypothetical protein EI94DRAFT_1705807 [Lactarius quietus]|nr:hypothetical protein EI94DRAFT_1705807 [Lactarius quietus]
MLGHTGDCNLILEGVINLLGLNDLEALKEELNETEALTPPLSTVLEHVLALEVWIRFMILNAILLTLQKITLAQQRDIAIIPQLRIWVMAEWQMDYVVIEYEKVEDNEEYP